MIPICLRNFFLRRSLAGCQHPSGDKMNPSVTYCVILVRDVVDEEGRKEEYESPFVVTKESQWSFGFLPETDQEIRFGEFGDNEKETIANVTMTRIYPDSGRMVIFCKVKYMWDMQRLRTQGWTLEGSVRLGAPEVEVLYQWHLNWADNGYKDKDLQEAEF